MNPLIRSDRFFPRAGGSAPRPLLRPLPLPFPVRDEPVIFLEFNTALRAWTERRPAPSTAGIAPPCSVSAG